MTSSAGDVSMFKCGYCGNLHTYSAEMCRDMLMKPGFTTITETPIDVVTLQNRLAASERERAVLKAANADLTLRLEQMRGALDGFYRKVADIADDWRSDWSDFDGRTLVSQIGDAAKEYVAPALSAPPGELVREVREVLENIPVDPKSPGGMEWVSRADALLARLGGEA
jgi:hypothetical protein